MWLRIVKLAWGRHVHTGAPVERVGEIEEAPSRAPGVRRGGARSLDAAEAPLFAVLAARGAWHALLAAPHAGGPDARCACNRPDSRPAW